MSKTRSIESGKKVKYQNATCSAIVERPDVKSKRTLPHKDMAISDELCTADRTRKTRRAALESQLHEAKTNAKEAIRRCAESLSSKDGYNDNLNHAFDCMRRAVKLSEIVNRAAD